MKRILCRLTSILLLLCMLCAALVCVCRLLVLHTPVRMYYQGQLGKTDAPYACIVVPGSGILGSSPGIYLRDRLDTALTLYNHGASEYIVLSGAMDEAYDLHEVDVMRRYLEENGVPVSAMILDRWGVDTAQTVLRARNAAQGGRTIICTQSLYVPRTLYLARCFGLDADIADSDIHIYTDHVGLARLRELFAAVKAVFEGIFVPDGAYPAAQYPLTGGDGDE